MAPGNYSLRVAGYSDPNLEGQIFLNDTELFFDGKQISLFIQTSKPFYKQGQTGMYIKHTSITLYQKCIVTDIDVNCNLSYSSFSSDSTTD